MKLLFLDIDGVLITTTDLLHGWAEFNQRCIDNLGSILRQSRPKIVLASTWRRYPSGRKDFARMLLQNNLLKFWSKYDITPSKGANRGEEIQAFLDENPKVTHFVIIDDDPGAFIWDERDRGRFFQASYKTGLTKEIANKAIAFFNSTPSEPSKAEE
jgi:hypothetical protein